MSSQTTTHAAKAPAKGAAKASSGTYISLMALVMMNVTIIGSVANDVQQAYYGLSSVTLFIIGALVFFLPTGLVAAELASGWGQRGGIFRWVGEAMGPGLAFTCLLILWFQTSINFGMGVASASATIGFYTPDWDWAVQFMNHPENQFFIILAWLAYYWGLTFLSTKGVKAFARPDQVRRHHRHVHPAGVHRHLHGGMARPGQRVQCDSHARGVQSLR